MVNGVNNVYVLRGYCIFLLGGREIKTPPSKREAASDEEALKVHVIIGDLDDTGTSNSKVDWWSAQKQKIPDYLCINLKTLEKHWAS
jgi:hypothetical protein